MLLLLLLPFVFYVSNSKSVRDHNLLDRGVVMVSGPIQWVIVSTLDSVGQLWNHYVALMNLQEENERLKGENGQLTAELASREEQRHENERLRELVGLRDRAPDVKMIFAQIIATSPTPLFRSVRIDRGSRDGLELGAAVVSHEGVVGRVAALGESYADVMLLVDGNSSTDVLVQRTRARARVRGQGGDEGMGIEVQYLARTANVGPGDVLITSGLGKTFPKGLPVGRVVSIERRAFGLYQRATVQPSVDFSRIEVVWVIQKGYSTDATYENIEAPELGPTGPVLEGPLPVLPGAVTPIDVPSEPRPGAEEPRE